MLSLIFSLFVLGCGKDDGDSSTGDDSDSDTDAAADTDTDTDTTADCIEVDGMVTTASGAPNDAVRVQMCSSETCIPQNTTKGAYHFPCLWADDFAFELAPISKGERYPNPSSPVTLVKGTPR